MDRERNQRHHLCRILSSKGMSIGKLLLLEEHFIADWRYLTGKAQWQLEQKQRHVAECISSGKRQEYCFQFSLTTELDFRSATINFCLWPSLQQIHCWVGKILPLKKNRFKDRKLCVTLSRVQQREEDKATPIVWVQNSHQLVHKKKAWFSIVWQDKRWLARHYTMLRSWMNLTAGIEQKYCWPK